MSLDFYVTSEPPAVTQPFGGNRAGRGRANPFDQPIKQSHEQKLYERGEWLEFKVDPTEVAKNVNRIRAAGQYLKLGTEVRVDKDTGRIAFRGVDYRPRAVRAKGATVNAEAAQPTGNGVPPAQSQPWSWEPQPEPATANQ